MHGLCRSYSRRQIIVYLSKIVVGRNHRNEQTAPFPDTGYLDFFILAPRARLYTRIFFLHGYVNITIKAQPLVVAELKLTFLEITIWILFQFGIEAAEFFRAREGCFRIITPGRQSTKYILLFLHDAWLKSRLPRFVSQQN